MVVSESGTIILRVLRWPVLLVLHLLDYNRQTVGAVVGEGVRLPSDDVGIEMILTQIALDKLRDVFNVL